MWVLDPEPAKELLLRRGKREGVAGEDELAAKVAEKLQYLPLALEMAAAYVAEHQGMGFAKYLSLYQEKEREFLQRREPGATSYPDSVYLAWRTTVERLPAGARAMLRLHAFFAPAPFPVKLFIDGAKELVEEARAAGAEVTADEYAVREWKSSLVRYSMAKVEPDDCVSVHGLVQAVERYELGARAAEVAQRAAAMYWRVTPAPSWDLESRALWAKLAHHSRALGGCALVEERLRGNFCARLAGAFREVGDYREGVKVATRALDIRERVLGPEHPATVASVNNLAALLEGKGDYEAAEALFRRALEACERALGPEHPNTLLSVNSLAVLLRNKGDYPAAEPLHRRTLEASERVLGPEHPDTLATVNNLALLLASKGDYQAAEPLHRRTLEALERVLGPEHPNTLTSVNNLALMLESRGDYRGAEPLHRRALDARERLLGPEHPDTLNSVSNLAVLLERKGDYQAAELLNRRALEAEDRVLGPEHPHTLISVNSLARLLASKGDYTAAELLYRRALETCEHVLGPEHPDTLTAVDNLARLLKKVGNCQAIHHCFEKSFEQELGPETPDNLASVNNLATPPDGTENYQAAEALFRRALEGARKVLGPDHPTTKIFAENHTACLADMSPPTE